MSKGDESTTDSNSTAGLSSRRRKLLGALGAGSVAGLAGCGGGGDDGGGATATPTPTEDDDTSTPGDTTDDGGDDTTTEESGVEYPNASHSMHIGDPIEEYSWELGRGGAPRNLYPLAMARLGGTGAGGEWYGLLADDWSASDTEITISIRGDSGWADGTPVSIRDFAVGWKLEYIYSRMRSPEQKLEQLNQEDYTPASIAEVIGDVTWDEENNTATFHAIEDRFKNFVPENFLFERMIALGGGGILGGKADEGDPSAADLLEEIEGLSDPWSDAGWEQRQEILGLNETATPSPDFDPTEWSVSGPFQVTEMQSDQVTLEANPHHWSFQDGNINFGKLDFKPMGSSNVVWTNLQQNNLDGINAMGQIPPNNVVESFPDNMEYHLYGGSYWTGMSANRHRDPTLGDTYVRQAIQHSLDQQQLINVGGTIADAPLRAPVGLQDPNYLDYVPEDLANQFNEYDHDVDRANTLLQSGGYVKSGDTWEDLNGDPIEYEYLTAATNVSQQQALVQQMNEVGLDVSMRRVSGTILANRVDQGDYELVQQGWWGGAEQGFITRALWSSARNYKLNPPWTWDEVAEWADTKDHIEYNTADWTDYITGYTAEDILDAGELFEWPAPPKGQYNHNVEFNDYPLAYQAHQVVNAPISESTRKEYRQNIAWVFNWDLFCMPYSKSANVAWQDHGEDWDAPSDVDEWQHNTDPLTRNIKQGKISANNDEA